MLKSFRNDLHYKLQMNIEEEGTSRNVLFSFIHPKPVLQIGFVCLLLMVGIFLGRLTQQPVHREPFTLKNFLTLNQSMEFTDGELNPFIGAVQKVKYNPEKNEIIVFYNTINDVRLQGKLENPAIQNILRQALTEENNPAVRLHAVKAISALTDRNLVLDSNIQGALLELLKNENNQGIRLQTLRIIKKVKFNKTIENALIRILLFDSNSALRIEAFQILTGQKMNQAEINSFINHAQNDSNEYIRYQAAQLINKIETIRNNKQTIEAISIRKKGVVQ